MRKRIFKIVLIVVVLAAILGFGAWFHLMREVSTYYESEVEHFNYSSVGVEVASGAPYWIWYVLPRVFRDKLPPGSVGYEAFGFILEEGQDAPIGFPTKTVGFQRVGINCALCHTGTFRTNQADETRILIGAPSTTFDLQSYLRFLFDCASDPRFNAENIIPEIQTVNDLSFVEILLYRFLIIPQLLKIR